MQKMGHIMQRPLQKEINFDALERNYRECVRLAGPNRQVIPAIKANAYGHGFLDVAKALQPQKPIAFWTGHIPEALALRRAGIRTPIIMFGGYLPAAIPELWEHGLTPTIYDEDGLACAARSSVKRPMPVFIKVDCGLGRLGIGIERARTFVRAVAGIPTLRIAGIYTHLPFKNLAGKDWALARAQGFLRLIDDARADGIEPEVTQLWGSSGLLSGLPDSSNAVCVGHALYGLSPLADSVPSDGSFETAFSRVVGQLIHVAEHASEDSNTTVSEYRTTNASRTGVVAFGYGDGMRRPVSGETITVLVNGRRVPVIGISLEHIVLDLSEGAPARVGDEVVFLGRAERQTITLDDWAQWLGCSVLEVIVGLGNKA